nr:hypothetical protein GCM10025732_02080 [Glycomyces mayteni]
MTAASAPTIRPVDAAVLDAEFAEVVGEWAPDGRRGPRGTVADSIVDMATPLVSPTARKRQWLPPGTSIRAR